MRAQCMLIWSKKITGTMDCTENAPFDDSEASG